MGFWGTLGKIGLEVAPYAAAPFTGGASLLAAPAANAAVKKWAASDAQKAAAQGIAPSKFDKYLTMAGDVASMVTPMGAAGAGLSTAAKVAGMASSGSAVAGDIANIARGSSTPNTSGTNGSSPMPPTVGPGGSGATSNPQGNGLGPSWAQRWGGGPAGNPNVKPVMPMGGFNYWQNPMNQLNQSTPNLAQSIFQGRQEAMANQPWRGGYGTTIYSGIPLQPTPIQMPPIYPNNTPQQRQFFGNQQPQ